MKIRSLATVLGAFLAFSAVADVPNKDKAQGKKAAAPEWMKLTVPTDGHKVFGDLVGTFRYTLKWWEAPGGTAQESKGTSKNKMILGGRFLQQETTGKAMGQKFEGIGYMGFDNLRQEYQSIWLDNMSTHIMATSGTWDPATKTMSETGTMSDVMSGDKNAWLRTELKVTDKKTHTYAMYTKDKEGKEFKSMEIEYKRK